MTSLATISNPFRSSIVSDPWKSLEADVPTIHQKAFIRCCEAIAHMRAKHETTGVLVHGEAGSGKTHLLARLHTHIAQEAKDDGPGGLEEAIFISAQLQTSAKRIWRHLRRRFASDLLRREDSAISQFERLVLHQLAKNSLVTGDSRSWLEQIRKEADGADKLRDALEDLFNKIDSRGQIGYKLRQVITPLLLKKNYGEASAWLRGESLPKSALQKVGIDVSLSDDEELGEPEEQDDQDSQIVFGLCGLATTEIPLVFCFDQVEALQTATGDKSGLVAFGQMIYDLHAFTEHLMIISCIQSAFLDDLRNTVREADFARIKAFDEVTLNPLTREEAFQLAKARMDALSELKQLRGQQTDPLWPLQDSDISWAFFTATGCTARRLLAHCADLYEAQRSGKPITRPPPVDQFLDQAWKEHKNKALEESEPSQTVPIIEEGLPLLLHLTHPNWRQSKQDLPNGVDLLFEGTSRKVAVSICNSSHWPSLVRKLDRLNTQMDNKQMNELVLLRDSRLPVGPPAVKTRALREQLIQKGARWVEPSVETLSVLESLRRLLADAQSGDLANHGATVETKTVQDWLAQCLSGELKNLLEEVLPTDTDLLDVTDLALYEDIAELLQRQHVISVAHASELLGRENKEVEMCVQRHSERIGVLGEPPAVLFHLVSEVSEA